jgi:hypothetical protein
MVNNCVMETKGARNFGTKLPSSDSKRMGIDSSGSNYEFGSSPDPKERKEGGGPSQDKL